MNEHQREIQKAYEDACDWLKKNDGVPHASERLAIYLRNFILTQRHDARDKALAALGSEYVNLADEVLALRAELAVKTEAGNTLAEFAKTAPGRLPERVTLAIAALADSPKAGGEISDGRIVGVVDELGPLVRMGTPPREPDPFEALLTWLDDMLWPNGVHKGACIEFGPELRRRILALRSAR